MLKSVNIMSAFCAIYERFLKPPIASFHLIHSKLMYTCTAHNWPHLHQPALYSPEKCKMADNVHLFKKCLICFMLFDPVITCFIFISPKSFYYLYVIVYF